MTKDDYQIHDDKPATPSVTPAVSALGATDWLSAASGEADDSLKKTRKTRRTQQTADQDAQENAEELQKNSASQATRRANRSSKKIQEMDAVLMADDSLTERERLERAQQAILDAALSRRASKGKVSDADETVQVKEEKHLSADTTTTSWLSGLSEDEPVAKSRSRRTRTTRSSSDENQEQVSSRTRRTYKDASKEADTTGRSSDESAEQERGASKSEAEQAPVKTGRKPGRPRKDAAARETARDQQDGADQKTSSKEGKQESGDRRSQQHNGRQARNNDRRQSRKNFHEPIAPKVSREELEKLKLSELKAKAQELGLDLKQYKLKNDLIEAVFVESAKQEGFNNFKGILDILQDGFGFIRQQGYLPAEDDVYMSASAIRRAGLRKGDYVEGVMRPVQGSEKFPTVHKIDAVNGLDPEEIRKRPRFGDLTPIYPDERLRQEHGKQSYTGRCIDLVAPIGKGQRGLIVSPPKAGKTTILKKIAESVATNNPEVHLICLLVDERPEEVTDMRRSIKGEVVASTFDMPSEQHISVSELVIERAKRLVEVGEDVVILLDSITRLARAYNLAQPASGRILSGGVDSTALYPPKRFLGAARNIEGGGSLTILASALIDTGSKMDEVIFEEFKGTGNMELKLDRDLADRRIYPAIDPIASGTRQEELLIEPNLLPFIWGIRRILANMNNVERAMTMLIKSLNQTDNNEEFLMRSARKAQDQGSNSVEL